MKEKIKGCRKEGEKEGRINEWMNEWMNALNACARGQKRWRWSALETRIYTYQIKLPEFIIILLQSFQPYQTTPSTQHTGLYISSQLYYRFIQSKMTKYKKKFKNLFSPELKFVKLLKTLVSKLDRKD